MLNSGIENTAGGSSRWEYIEDKKHEARRLREEERGDLLEAEIFRKQASRIEVKPGDEEKNRRGYFMQSWTTSTKGLGVLGTETGRGKRGHHIQA